jgi:hypothetical protein
VRGAHQLPELQPARPGSHGVVEDDDTSCIQLAVLLRPHAQVIPLLRTLLQGFAIARTRTALIASGPSVISNSILGSAHSVELKSPSSQAA